MRPRCDDAGVAAGTGVHQEVRLSPDHITIRLRTKRMIVWLALFGLLPISLAEWLIHRWGMRDA